MDSNPLPLFAEERRSEIVALLKTKSKVTVPELCDAFAVSPATIRTDLRILENQGALKRTHGGAINVNKTNYEPTTMVKLAQNMEEKKRIAEFASQLVENGDTIALDTGTTTLELAQRLTGKHNLTIVTNDISIALYLEQNSDARIIVLGGALRRGHHCTASIITSNTMSDINVDIAFIASNSFDVERGFCTPSMEQAEVKKAMMRSAVQVVALVDSSKFNCLATYRFAQLTDVHRMITDSGIAHEDLVALRKFGDLVQLSIV